MICPVLYRLHTAWMPYFAFTRLNRSEKVKILRQLDHLVTPLVLILSSGLRKALFLSILKIVNIFVLLSSAAAIKRSSYDWKHEHLQSFAQQCLKLIILKKWFWCKDKCIRCLVFRFSKQMVRWFVRCGAIVLSNDDRVVSKANDKKNSRFL